MMAELNVASRIDSQSAAARTPLIAAGLNRAGADASDPGAERLLWVRFSDGHAHLVAPHGDLEVTAPHGRLLLRAGTHLACQAMRDVALRAGRRVDVVVGAGGQAVPLRVDPSTVRVGAARTQMRTERLDWTSEVTRLALGRVRLAVEELRVDVRRLDRVCQRSLERCVLALTDVVGLAETKARRWRGTVRETLAVRAGHIELRSGEQTTVNGKQVLVG
jgi:hypothetical protein